MIELFRMLAYDMIFVALAALAFVLLAQSRRASFAVLKRNFVGYFSNPTGYVFLCLFVLLTSLAAFWPHDFFVANLANLDQLNRWLPQIMLIFIPAITMSIWAEEKRQGTDELLLTLPATDFDIVIGKYLAAASIFTCSLLFSQICNYIVLIALADWDVDTGLLFTTYFGYWFIGLAMLAIGMVASFLTNNLTVGFILGLALNAPLAFANYLTGMVSDPNTASWMTRWSLSQQFDDFGRGVISISSISFFALLTGIGLYVSMILIGSRHWYGGKDGQSLLGHYLARAAALVVALVGINVALANYDFIRIDTTHGRVSSLSPQTKNLVRNLNAKHPIVVDAFLSREVPEDYVKTKYTIVSMLKELRSLAGGKFEVRLHNDLEPFSEEATRAEEQFGIKPQSVRFTSRGAIKDQEILLGAAFSCGLEKVVIPFFDYGLPVEYELVRSISTVARGERKKLGIVQTDARVFGGFDMGGGMMPRQIPKQAIVEELEKQYKVEEIDPSKPIEVGNFDVVLVVQPSSLGPQQLNYVVEALRAGQPMAIFEDPMPRVIASTVGTNQPKPPQGGMFGGGGPPPPKGDIRALWELLGIQPAGDIGGRDIPGKVVWQHYNPYPKLQQLRGLGPELIFIRSDIPGASVNPFNQQDAITSGLEELLFPFAGAIQSKGTGKDLTFTELVSTADSVAAGTVDVNDWMNVRDPSQIKYGDATGKRYVLAARIKGEFPKAESAGQSEEKGEGESAAKKADEKTEKTTMHAVYVSDIDLMDSQFVMFRANRDRLTDDFNFRFDNVTFILNVIDSLAGDDRFVEIRKRKPRFSTLQLIEQKTSAAREAELKDIKRSNDEFERRVKEEEDRFKKEYAEAEEKFNAINRRRTEGEVVDPDEFRRAQTELELKREAAQRRLEVIRARLKQQYDKQQQATRRKTEQEVQVTQNWCKSLAVVLPSIPPLAIGLVVFLYRRVREREGISRTRRK